MSEFLYKEESYRYLSSTIGCIQRLRIGEAEEEDTAAQVAGEIGGDGSTTRYTGKEEEEEEEAETMA